MAVEECEDASEGPLGFENVELLLFRTFVGVPKVRICRRIRDGKRWSNGADGVPGHPFSQTARFEIPEAPEGAPMPPTCSNFFVPGAGAEVFI